MSDCFWTDFANCYEACNSAITNLITAISSGGQSLFLLPIYVHNAVVTNGSTQQCAASGSICDCSSAVYTTIGQKTLFYYSSWKTSFPGAFGARPDSPVFALSVADSLGTPNTCVTYSYNILDMDTQTTYLGQFFGGRPH